MEFNPAIADDPVVDSGSPSLMEKESNGAASKSANAAAAAPFRLAYGYICPANPDSKKDKDCAQGEPALEIKKPNRSQAFWFHNRRIHDPILLYGNQVVRLIDELPNAYAAVKNQQQDYLFLLSESKSNKITLEVSAYRDKYYLFLKKYFKGIPGHGHRHSFASGVKPVLDNKAWTWLPSTAVGLDPFKDDPEAILDYVLSIRQRFWTDETWINFFPPATHHSLLFFL